MITCTLGEKKYTVDYVTGRALRNIGKAMDAWREIVTLDERRNNDAEMKVAGSFEKQLDVMAEWFCNMLFAGQFNAEELYDNYPADQLMIDIYKAMMCVWGHSTELLNEFPMTPAATK